MLILCKVVIGSDGMAGIVSAICLFVRLFSETAFARYAVLG